MPSLSLVGMRCGGLVVDDLFLVDVLRIEHPLADDGQARRRDLAEEAAFVALVAGRAAELFDFDENGIDIAIDEHALDQLHVAAFFTFSPELLPRAAIV